MTKETNGIAPDLIVLGRDEAGKPRAARFPAGHDNLVAKAAKAMNHQLLTLAERPDVTLLPTIFATRPIQAGPFSAPSLA